MGRLLVESGQPVVAIAGRTANHVREAAHFVAGQDRTVASVAIQELPRFASRVLIAVSDDAVAGVAAEFARAGLTEGVVLHTSGARGPAVLDSLRRTGIAGGVLHPLQTVVTPEQGVRDLRHISFGLAGDPEAVAWGREIIALCGGKEIVVAADRMPAYHAGAVLAGNAVTALIDAAARVMTLAGIDYQEAIAGLAPLSRTSLENALRMGPRNALTGPMVRGDVATVRAHVGALSHATDPIRDLYRAAGFAVLDLMRERGAPPGRVAEIAAELNELEKCQ